MSSDTMEEMPVPGFDVEALSGVLGSISIACWVFVFTPQIVENFRRHSAEGLSIVFIVVWLLGDLFNIVGAILQGVLPTMIILAVYYTIADIVLLLQCFYYRGFTLSDAPRLPDSPPPERAILDGTEQENEEQEQGQEQDQEQDGPLLNASTLPTGTTAEQLDEDEETPLLSRTDSPVRQAAPQVPTSAASAEAAPRAVSPQSLRDRIITAVDGTHLNPAVPLVDPSTRPATPPEAEKSTKGRIWSALFNIAAVLVVCLSGVVGWWLSTQASRSPFQRHDDGSGTPPPNNHQHRHGKPSVELPYDVGGQFFGYLCMLFYLGSRLPQLLLNYRRKSTEGVSMLFFLFACVGNLTYVLSIFAYEPPCARYDTSINYETGQPFGYSDKCYANEWSAQYSRYILVNLSWLLGSAGTLLLDGAVFVQFWMYRGRAPNEGTIQVGTAPNSPLDSRNRAQVELHGR